MHGSTLIADWLGTGNDADLPDPVALDALLYTLATGFFYAQDVKTLYVLNRTTVQWDVVPIVGGGGGGGGITELTGDVTAGPGAGSQVATLATVNANVGTFTYSTVTVNAKGLVTAASSGAAPVTSANPTATAGPVAVNGAATTYMRSDAAPAVQKASAAQFGIVEVDGTTITASGGVISAAAGASGINQLTGDVTAGPGVGSQAATLATVNGNVGSFTYASITVNAKGLVTAASSGAAPAAAANPTATAKDTAVNGAATTYMRSDAAPAVQKASDSQFGIVKVDGTSITASGGVISSTAASPAGANFAIQYNDGGAFGGATPLDNGYILIGSTGNPPVAALITEGDLIEIGVNAGAMNISVAQIANNMIIANITGHTEYPAATTLTSILDEIIGNTQGDLIHRAFGAWLELAPGTAGQVLTTNGAGANVSWEDVASVGGGAGGLTLVTKTADYTLLSGDSGKIYDNIGAGADIVLSLPPAARGLNYSATVMANHYIKLLADGTDVISVDVDSSAAGGYVRSTSQYSCIALRAHGAGRWIVSSIEGAWKIDS